MKSKLVSSGLSAVALLALAATHASAVPVKVELSLLIDVSGSVDTTEFNLQKNGYVQAFQSPGIQALIAATAPAGGVAVNFIQWSGAGQEAQSVGWTLLTDAASSNAFAAAINGVTRAFSGNTAPGSAINFAVPLFTGNGFEGQNLVIDVSGDGAENDGASTSAARTAALAAGITRINGLPILGESGLLAFYQGSIQGGATSFTMPADSFATFDTALTQKLSFEIGGGGPSTPDGGSSLLLLSGALGCVAFLHRRKSVR